MAPAFQRFRIYRAEVMKISTSLKHRAQKKCSIIMRYKNDIDSRKNEEDSDIMSTCSELKKLNNLWMNRRP